MGIIAWWRRPFDQRNPESACAVHGGPMRDYRRFLAMLAAMAVVVATELPVRLAHATGLPAELARFGGGGFVVVVMGWACWSTLAEQLGPRICFSECSCGRRDRVYREHARWMNERWRRLAKLAAEQQHEGGDEQG